MNNTLGTNANAVSMDDGMPNEDLYRPMPFPGDDLGARYEDCRPCENAHERKASINFWVVGTRPKICYSASHVTFLFYEEALGLTRPTPHQEDKVCIGGIRFVSDSI
jgi:hypothetical protein